jgi:VIT1/CCC1 family predicted Fe2+/Mn2+ transporter
MRHSFKTGFGFGITSAIITTLGLMVGLQAGTGSVIAVIGGVLTIAIADAFSDSLGIHISRESDKNSTKKDVWESTASTFIAKLVFAMSFIPAILLVALDTAIVINVAWGMLLLAGLSYYVAKQEHAKPSRVIAEHLAIAAIVIGATHYAGLWIRAIFV